MEPTKKSGSCSWNIKDLRQVTKKTDLNKLYKKVEKLFHHNEKNPTFIPSTLNQTNHEQGVPPPYPTDIAFGTGFPALPPLQNSTQNSIPPSYGWALNAVPSTASTPLSGMLTLDIQEGSEAAGSGFDDLPKEDDSYERLFDSTVHNKRSAQIEQLKEVERKLDNEKKLVATATRDIEVLNQYLQENYYNCTEDDTGKLEAEVSRLETEIRKIRDRSPNIAVPPPRPPPPRSNSLDINALTWMCCRCDAENPRHIYRCWKCNMPGKRIDPIEIDRCGCEHCEHEKQS